MGITSISLKKETKEKLNLLRKIYEAKLGKSLSWDEFFEKLLEKEKEEVNFEILKLSDKEAEIMLDLLKKGRESWRRYA
ncbi:MAG: VapB-type antitoxin [Desulfurococcales archaeon ex4484_217_1]|nr:MAG: VapB-type antitoxin [Desulfurococcales archaeon ex4484_217_1]